MTARSKVDKNVCFEILKRSLRTVSYYRNIEGKVVFIGPAKDWQEYYKDSNYQETLKKIEFYRVLKWLFLTKAMIFFVLLEKVN